ncbi:MAG: metal ABC transporter ATP-binding protein [Caldilinea sp.]
MLSGQKRSVLHDASMPAVDLQNVNVRYDQTTALAHVTLRLNRGDRVAVVGPNGAGKSTLFHVIAGVVRPDEGQVRIYGSGPGGHICVGYVPQRKVIDWDFPVTVTDVVMMGRVGKMGFFRWPSRHDRDIVRASLEEVGMSAYASRQIGELSGGQQQRVFLARVLAQEAELLLMDEPLTGLDMPSQEAILALIDRIQQHGVTVMVASHDLNQAGEQFPLVLLLNRHIVAFGPPNEVLTTSNLLAAYGGHMHVVRTGNGDLLLADTCCSGGAEMALPALSHVSAPVIQPVQQETVEGMRPPR